MPRNHKKFTPKAAKEKREPITFEVYDETFTAHPHIQGAVVLDFISATQGASEDSDTARVTEQLMPFMEAALLPESYERFVTLTRSHDKILDIEDLMDILGWLLSEYTDRPTNGSEK